MDSGRPLSQIWGIKWGNFYQPTKIGQATRKLDDFFMTNFIFRRRTCPLSSAGIFWMPNCIRCPILSLTGEITEVYRSCNNSLRRYRKGKKVDQRNVKNTDRETEWKTDRQTCMLESTCYLYSNAVQLHSAGRQTAQFYWILFMITRISCSHYERTHHIAESDIHSHKHMLNIWTRIKNPVIRFFKLTYGASPAAWLIDWLKI